MKNFIILLACIALSYAQFSSTEGPSQIIGVPGPRWQGPFANHILGQAVGDTPEVAAARAAHYKAHAKILEVLPVLPAEEDLTVSEPKQVPQVNVPQQQPQITEQAYAPGAQITIPSPVQAHVVHQQVQTNPEFIQLAGAVPRSELGETPEVAAARKAHLAAYAEIEKLLPKLEETSTNIPEVQQTQVVTHQPQVVYQQPQVLYQQPQISYQQPAFQTHVIPTSGLGETPEVAAARKAHLAAYAEIEKLLPKLTETTTNIPEVHQPQVVNYQPQVVYQQPQVLYQQPQDFYQQPAYQTHVVIPTSGLGETPEVAAARKAHLAAYAEIEKSLSKLVETTTTVPVVQQPQIQPQVVNQQPQVVYDRSLDANQFTQLWKQQLQRNLEWFYNPQQFNSYVPQDTPEVAAAKAEHLKLLQTSN